MTLPCRGSDVSFATYVPVGRSDRPNKCEGAFCVYFNELTLAGLICQIAFWDTITWSPDTYTQTCQSASSLISTCHTISDSRQFLYVSRNYLLSEFICYLWQVHYVIILYNNSDLISIILT